MLPINNFLGGINMNIKFLVDSKGNMYTTAFMIGEKLRKAGIHFNQDDKGSYHYGSYLNRTLAKGLNKSYRAGGSVDYTLDDFPKLIDVQENKKVINYLLSQHMCNDASVALTKYGGTLRALDLYTFKAFKQILNAHSVKFTNDDIIEVVGAAFDFELILRHSERDEVTSDSKTVPQKLFQIH